MHSPIARIAEGERGLHQAVPRSDPPIEVPDQPRPAQWRCRVQRGKGDLLCMAASVDGAAVGARRCDICGERGGGASMVINIGDTSRVILCTY